MKRLLTTISMVALIGSAASAASAEPFHHYTHDDRFSSWQGRHPDWRSGHRMSMNDWRRGERFDYRRYHLRAPPRGYEWRRVDGNYVLAAAATGLIASIIAASH
ncbi:MAG TPA: RcnB family protein [Caulobacteraceae bacterium]|jgi:Ni/Co efflux regulator RcnB